MPYLLKYTLKRIGLMLVTTFIILTLTFFLVKMLPGANYSAGTDEQRFSLCMDEVAKGNLTYFNHEVDYLGTYVFSFTDSTGLSYFFYHRPVIQQYGAWLTGIFTRWDWGESTAYVPGLDAMSIIGQRLPASMLINVISLLLSLPIGFALGIWAALKKNTTTDHVISTLVMVFISVPSFVTISLLMKWLGFDMNWLPTSWTTNKGPGMAVASMVIPVLSLSFGTVATFTRYTRAELTEVMSSDFLLLARTKGLTKRQCVVRHALRNSMVPIVPMIIGEFISVLGGSMILEQLYLIPGIGELYVTCITRSDWNLLLVDMAVYTLIGLLANLLVDLSYGVVDPRIRMGAKA